MIWDITPTNICHPKQATVRAQHRFSSFPFFSFLFVIIGVEFRSFGKHMPARTNFLFTVRRHV
jgi:hypothetical protein